MTTFASRMLLVLALGAIGCRANEALDASSDLDAGGDDAASDANTSADAVDAAADANEGFGEVDANDPSDANDFDANNADANNFDANNVDANNVDANNVDANNADANDVDANNADANDVDANNVDAFGAPDAYVMTAEMPDCGRLTRAPCTGGGP